MCQFCCLRQVLCAHFRRLKANMVYAFRRPKTTFSVDVWQILCNTQHTCHKVWLDNAAKLSCINSRIWNSITIWDFFSLWTRFHFSLSEPNLISLFLYEPDFTVVRSDLTVYDFVIVVEGKHRSELSFKKKKMDLRLDLVYLKRRKILSEKTMMHTLTQTPNTFKFLGFD